MSKFIIAISGLVLILAPTSEAGAGNALKRLQTVCLMSDIRQDAKKLGLDEETITASVFVALKRDLPKLEVRQCNAKEDGMISISIITVEIVNKAGISVGYATSVRMHLDRPATILTGNDYQTVGFSYAEVWHAETLLVGDARLAAEVIEVLKEFETKFAAAYYGDN
jgi:hypothetical protein